MSKRQGARGSEVILLSVFIVSFCVLAFEVSLTRIFSVLLRYHFVFLAISLALCGLGLGGLIYFKLRGWLRKNIEFLPFIWLIILIFSLSLPATIIILFKTPLASQFLNPFTISLVPFVPFLLAGIFLAAIFEQYAKQSGKLYFADLSGAGIACLGVILLLKHFGGINAPILLGSLGLLGAVLLSLKVAKGRFVLLGSSIILLLSTFFLFYLNRTQKFIDIPPISVENPQLTKPLFVELSDPFQEAKIVYTEWNAYCRTDVVEEASAPTIKYIYTDGEVPTHMLKFSIRQPISQLQNLQDLKRSLNFLPFYLGNNETMLSIGPGGGLDILLGLLGGVKEIEGVEINPSIIRIMKKYRQFNGGIYELPGVKIYVDEGRSFICRSKKKYDIIYLALTQTATGQSLGLSLVESYIHTQDAFKDYLDHLTENGKLVLITQEEPILIRGIVTALAALRAKGIDIFSQGFNHIITMSIPLSEFPTTPYRFLLILKKSAFCSEECNLMSSLAKKFGFIPLNIPGKAVGISQKVGGFLGALPVVYDPKRMVVAAVNSEKAIFQYQDKSLYVAPCRDDSPFFFDLTFRWDLSTPEHRQILWICLSGLIVVFIFGLLVAWGKYKKGKKNQILALLKFSLYFSLLGLGFMLIEIALAQKFILFLGYPTRTLSVILFALLIGGALGSLTSHYWLEELKGKRGKTKPACAGRAESREPKEKEEIVTSGLVLEESREQDHAITRRMALRVSKIALGIFVIVLIYSLVLKCIFLGFLGAALLVRILLTAILISPLGALMGIPFPAGIRMVKEVSQEDIPWMWGVNGIMSVSGSVLAVILAKLFGFSITLVCGALTYLLLFLLCLILSLHAAGKD